MTSRKFLMLGCCLWFVTGCGGSTETTTDRAAEDTQPADAATTTAAQESDAQEPAATASPQERFEAVKQEYDDAYATFLKAYQSAQDNAARQAAMATMPNPDDYAARLIEIADQHPQTEAAVDALVWVAGNSRGTEAPVATQKLLQLYSSNPKVAPIIFMMRYRPTDGAEELLRGLLNSESETLQAVAKYTLGSMLISSDPNSEEGAALLQSVVDDFANVEIAMGSRSFKIAPMAAGELTEATKLQIGMVAPDIEGTDLDGVDFKLSDYRGKVVVLDFWGHW